MNILNAAGLCKNCSHEAADHPTEVRVRRKSTCLGYGFDGDGREVPCQCRAFKRNK